MTKTKKEKRKRKGRGRGREEEEEEEEQKKKEKSGWVDLVLHDEPFSLEMMNFRNEVDIEIIRLVFTCYRDPFVIWLPGFGFMNHCISSGNSLLIFPHLIFPSRHPTEMAFFPRSGKSLSCLNCAIFQAKYSQQIRQCELISAAPVFPLQSKAACLLHPRPGLPFFWFFFCVAVSRPANGFFVR
jgi:hypothetical protein